MNVVMTGGGGFVEVQGTAEGAPFTRAQMDALLALADAGIRELVAAQQAALGRREALVLASNNAKKLAELQDACSRRLPIELVAQGALGIAEADEPHATFVENALAKARHAARAGGRPAIADDSGLCVDALRRRAGRAVGALRAVSRAARRATAKRGARRRTPPTTRCCSQRLTAASTAVRASSARWWRCARADDPEPLIAFGRWHGEILDAPRGQGGFGYDPLMFIAVARSRPSPS